MSPAQKSAAVTRLTGRSRARQTATRIVRTTRAGVRRTSRVVKKVAAAARPVSVTDRILWYIPEEYAAAQAFATVSGVGGNAELAARQGVQVWTAGRTGFAVGLPIAGQPASTTIVAKSLIPGYGPYVVHKGIGKLRRALGTVSKPGKNAKAIDRFTYALPEVFASATAFSELKTSGKPDRAMLAFIENESAYRSGIRPFVETDGSLGYRIRADQLIAGQGPNVGYTLIRKGLSWIGIRAPRAVRARGVAA